MCTEEVNYAKRKQCTRVVGVGRQKEDPISLCVAAHMRCDILLHHNSVVVAPGQLRVTPDIVNADQQRPRLPASLLGRQIYANDIENDNNSSRRSIGCRRTAHRSPSNQVFNSGRNSITVQSVPTAQAATPRKHKHQQNLSSKSSDSNCVSTAAPEK